MTKDEILKWLKRLNLAFGGEAAYTLEGGYTVNYTSIIADIFAAVSKMETPPMTCKDCPYFEPVWGDSLLGRCTQAKAWYENRCIWDYCSNGRITETAEPQPDGIQFRTVDDLGRICIPKDIRDKLGIKPGTECAVYATDELTSEEIIVIRRKKNDIRRRRCIHDCIFERHSVSGYRYERSGDEQGGNDGRHKQPCKKRTACDGR